MNTNTKTKETTAYTLVICGVFAAVMVVCSWIAIPLPSGVPINLAVLGVLPVSYTHLDVYKRQGIGRSDGRLS